MKFMLMFARAEWEDTATKEEQEKLFAPIIEWWASQRRQGKIVEGFQLQPPHTATTVV